nr:MAG TPA: hypothetical protein [Caudoviricetes sp.]
MNQYFFGGFDWQSKSFFLSKCSNFFDCHKNTSLLVVRFGQNLYLTTKHCNIRFQFFIFLIL